MAGALDEAFVRHRPALLRYLRARGAADDAEDVLQELWLKLGRIDPAEIETPLSYFYRMAHNQMLDRRRAAARLRSREEGYRLEAVEADQRPGIEDVLIGRERLRDVEQVLAALGAKTDYVFRRHRIERVAQRDIADELGVTLSAVEKHLQKAYRAVAAAREEDLDTGPFADKGKQPHERG